MERMSIKSYAVKNKMSMFNVVKMVKSGELKSEVVEENGKEVTYILSDAITTKVDVSVPPEDNAEKEDLQERVARLEQDVAIMKREMDALKMSMGIKG
jgi:uncharacterized protein YceH (UPF0502 family)